MILLKIAGKPVWWEILIMVPFVNIVICPTRPFPLTDHVRDGVHSAIITAQIKWSPWRQSLCCWLAGWLRLSGRGLILPVECVRLADMEVNLSPEVRHPYWQGYR